MALKRAKFYSYGNDDLCGSVRKFIEDAGILLDVRDLEKQPLTALELKRLIGHLNVEHFLNKLSGAYTKSGLDKEVPSRDEVIDMMAKDPTLIRKPIIKTSRLVTIGCDKKKIADMLQLTPGEDSVGTSGPAAAHKVAQKASAR